MSELATQICVVRGYRDVCTSDAAGGVRSTKTFVLATQQVVSGGTKTFVLTMQRMVCGRTETNCTNDAEGMYILMRKFVVQRVAMKLYGLSYQLVIAMLSMSKECLNFLHLSFMHINACLGSIIDCCVRFGMKIVIKDATGSTGLEIKTRISFPVDSGFPPPVTCSSSKIREVTLASDWHWLLHYQSRIYIMKHRKKQDFMSGILTMMHGDSSLVNVSVPETFPDGNTIETARGHFGDVVVHLWNV
ncbi:hypothetical protein F2Q70_00022004 [Brassica cretica]|uniref:Uncharacterized protein n=2 Tax=Brassica cretica TaxID=69181 RepID=A0A8S9GVW1_BRACR|nr:hypothetical protein F2Q70_00022004 [Brassica cretica]KAF2555934.1 hypothetical protein F2Q68_00015793 [Brassica cretica]KAF3612173.1 hypothetical protein DY000_02048361 [Brassica cretica]